MRSTQLCYWFEGMAYYNDKRVFFNGGLVLTGYFAKSKLSQNRDKIDFDNVVTNLNQAGNHDLARAMTNLDDDQS